MSLRIRSYMLSDDCRNDIRKLFDTRRFKHVDIYDLLWKVEIWLYILFAYQDSEGDEPAGAKRRSTELTNLLGALHGLSGETKTLLQAEYHNLYRMPGPQWAALRASHQSSSTHFVWRDREGNPGKEVPLHALLRRIIRSAERLEAKLEKSVPRRGPRKDVMRIGLTKKLMQVYEVCTGQAPTATRGGTFDEFLGLVLVDAAGEREQVTRRKTILEAQAMEEIIPPFDAPPPAKSKADRTSNILAF